MVFLEQFDYEIQLIPGKDNISVDILSRYPQDGGQNVAGRYEEPVIATFKTAFEPDFHRTLDDLQRADLKLGPILHHMEDGELLEYGPFKRINGILCTKVPLGNFTRTTMTQSLVSGLVEHTYEKIGHYGTARVLNYLKAFCSWPKTRRQIHGILRTCDFCQVKISKSKAYVEPIKSQDVEDIVTVVFFSPFPPSIAGAYYAFVVVNLFSKFTKLYASKKATARAAVTMILDDFFNK